MIVFYLLIIIFGLIVGSFISALTFRLPRKISVLKGRSFCDYCKKSICWYDNIPLFSYLILRGKCRSCRKNISLRYPLIEIICGLVFLLIYILTQKCLTILSIEPICNLTSTFGIWTLPYLLLISSNLITVFIVDLEERFIPDELVFFSLFITITTLVVFSVNELYLNLSVAFIVSAFLLLIHLITSGRGM